MLIQISMSHCKLSCSVALLAAVAPVVSTHLLGIHRRCTERVDNDHVGSSKGVDEVSSVALPQAVHHAGLI